MQNSEAINLIAPIKRRVDLTFKHNRGMARHDWLRLTPAYSVKIVEDILQNKDTRLKVFDPFSGTGTTPLCAAFLGFDAVSAEINPFLIWFANVKLSLFSDETISECEEKILGVQSAIESKGVKISQLPPIANIERWWGKQQLEYLSSVKGEIDSFKYRKSDAKDLLLIAFCRSLIELSNADFNHQSMSFKPSNAENVQHQLALQNAKRMHSLSACAKPILESALNNPKNKARALLADAKDLRNFPENDIDIIITSPPYPNRMSYIRELRPYMYWLGYLKNSREAGELDCKAIGGTWGIATSRLSDWRLNGDSYLPKYLIKKLEEIAQSKGKSGILLSNYVGKYFEDMWGHFKAAKRILKKGAEIHYIIGNSKFYESVVPSEKIFADMLKQCGYKQIETQILRKRNSKKELYEYKVSAQR